MNARRLRWVISFDHFDAVAQMHAVITGAIWEWQSSWQYQLCQVASAVASSQSWLWSWSLWSPSSSPMPSSASSWQWWCWQDVLMGSSRLVRLITAPGQLVRMQQPEQKCNVATYVQSKFLLLPLHWRTGKCNFLSIKSSVQPSFIECSVDVF